MTYWLYDPKKLATTSSIIPYRQKDLGELLNFLTFITMLTYLYVFKTNQMKKYGHFLIAVAMTIFFAGITVGRPKHKHDEFIMRNFNNYDNSLFID